MRGSLTRGLCEFADWRNSKGISASPPRVARFPHWLRIWASVIAASPVGSGFGSSGRGAARRSRGGRAGACRRLGREPTPKDHHLVCVVQGAQHGKPVDNPFPCCRRVSCSEPGLTTSFPHFPRPRSAAGSEMRQTNSFPRLRPRGIELEAKF